MRREVTAGAVFVVTVLGALGIAAGPAAAHAELRSSEPAAGQALSRPPTRLLLRFTEPVEVVFGALRVYDGEGRRVPVGSPRHPGEDRRAVTASLPELETGTYVVTWRVSSADAHNVRGAFTFRAGSAPPGQGEALARRLLAAQGGSAVVGAVAAGVRALGFAALVVLAGGIAFVVAIWPAGAADPRLRRLLGVAWAALVAATGAAVGLNGAAAAGLGLADAVRPSLLTSALDTRFGRLSLARLLLLAVLGAALFRSRLGSRASRTIAVLAAGGVLATVALSGHAGTGRLVAAALVADVIHLGAVSVWIGGLAVLAVCLLRERMDDAEPVARRFSDVAVWSVGLIALTGLFQGWRQVGEPAALTGTTYGRLLLVKVVLVAAVVALGAANRSRLRRRPVSVTASSPGPGAAPADARPPSLGRLRKSVAVEAAISAAVLVVVSLLVSAVPGRIAYGRPYSAELDARRVLVDLTVDPARAGPADVHLYTLDRSGQTTDVAGVEADLRLAARDLGPLRVPLRRAGPGHFAAYGFTLPLAGSWELTLTVELKSGGSERVTTTVPVR